MARPDRSAFGPDRAVPFVDAAYRVVAGEGSLAEVAERLHDLERKHGVFLRPAKENSDIPDAELDAWIEENLLPFLDETHLVMWGPDMQRSEIDVCDDRGRWLGASNRAWGAILANWANERGWPPNHPARQWTYVDFYLGPPPLLGYDDFVRVVLQAIRLP